MSATAGPASSVMLALNKPARSVVWALRIISIAAFAVAGYLAFMAFQAGDIAGCASGGVWSCEHVLHSRWAKVLGIPVSIPAAALYASLFTSLLFVGPRVPDRVRNFAWSIVTVLILAAGSAAIWFITLQVFVLKHLCMYCMTVHSLGLLATLIVLAARPLPVKTTSMIAGLGVAATALLMMVQLVTTPPATHREEVYDQVASDEAQEEVLEFTFDDDFMDEELAGVEEPAVEDFDDGNVGQVELEKEITTPTSIPAQNIDGGTPLTSFHEDEVEPIPTLTPQPPVGGPVENATDSPTTNGSSVEETRTARRSVSKKAKKRLVKYPGANINLNVSQWPMLGTPTADNVVVELFDYTCQHCREMNQHIDVARQKFGNQLCVIVMPVPLSRECNDTVQVSTPEHAEACEIARLAVAVWRIDADMFPVFHRWLFAVPRNRTAAEARQYAETLVPPAALSKQMQGALVNKFIQRHVTLYKRAGEGTLPKLLTEKMTIEGKMVSADALCAKLRERLQMTE